MKKVRKRDLVILIARCYWEFIDPEHKPTNDILDGHGDIQIDIDSVYIHVRDIGGLLSKADVKRNVMNEFAKNIEAITFGNLKVIRIGSMGYSTWIDIACAYEVVE